MTRSPGAVSGYRALALYLGTVFVAGGLVAPWLHGGARSLAARVRPLAPLAAFPFHRYLNRSILLVALVGLWPFVRVSTSLMV